MTAGEPDADRDRTGWSDMEFPTVVVISTMLMVV
jgi:hypothetical protein